MILNNIKLLILLSISLSYACTVSATEGKPPNIILIMMDSLRAGNLGCYGYHQNTSPNIDAFAQHETLYENCFSPGTWTIPANASLLTSLYLPQHGANTWESFFDRSIPNMLTTLHKQNYRIGLFGSHSTLLRQLKKSFPLFFFSGYTENSESHIATQFAVSWIQKQKRPFFLWLYILEPHSPYTPPAPFNTQFPYEQHAPLPIQQAGNDNDTDCIPFAIAQDGITNPDYYRAQYDGEIAYADSLIATVLAQLKTLKLYDESIIIITADHGETMEEHHLCFSHGFAGFNELMHIPFLMKLPDQQGVQRITQPVSLIDIYPTVCAAMGLEAPKDVQGCALQKALPQKRPLYAYGEESHSYTLLYDTYKLISSPHKKELFNLSLDPTEQNNIARTDSSAFTMLTGMALNDHKKMHAWKNENIRTKGKHTLSCAGSNNLKSLGYLQ